MAYATTEELAAALRITVTAANTAGLQICLDAAAAEIDDALAASSPVDYADSPLVNRVNVLRAVEWWKANDAAYGIPAVTTQPGDSFARHAITLLPLRAEFGVA